MYTYKYIMCVCVCVCVCVYACMCIYLRETHDTRSTNARLAPLLAHVYVCM